MRVRLLTPRNPKETPRNPKEPQGYPKEPQWQKLINFNTQGVLLDFKGHLLVPQGYPKEPQGNP